MTDFKRFLVVSTAAVSWLVATVAHGADPAIRDRLWEEVVPELEQALTLEERHDSLPDSAWFGPDKASNQADINALLDRAVTLLSDAPSQTYRVRIRDLEEAIREAREDIARLRQRRVSAPDQAWWRDTAADIDAEIAAIEVRIGRYQAEIGTVRQQFATQLRASGLELTTEQLDFLLSTVIGDDLIDLGIAFDNVRGLIGQLEGLLVDSGESLDAARRYYGMYAVLLEVLLTMHDTMLDTVAHYRQRLNAIDERTRALMADSRRLKRISERHQAVLAANIEAQQLTLDSARRYSDYLREQADDVARSREQLRYDLAVARNTYETVRLSGELVQMMRSGQRLLDTLFARRMPTLFTFQNLELKREFERLTLRLRDES